MNEGYNLLDKVVGVLENANLYKIESNIVNMQQGVTSTIVTVSADAPGVYLAISLLDAGGNSLPTASFMTNGFTSTGTFLFGRRATRTVLGGGGGNINVAIVSLDAGDVVNSISYGAGNDYQMRGDLALVKLLGGGYCVTLLRALEGRWSHERGIQSLRQGHRGFGKLGRASRSGQVASWRGFNSMGFDLGHIVRDLSLLGNPQKRNVSASIQSRCRCIRLDSRQFGRRLFKHEYAIQHNCDGLSMAKCKRTTPRNECRHVMACHWFSAELTPGRGCAA